MTCPCNDTKRKMPGCDAGTPPVLEVHSKECPVLFHTVTIPASIGDLESMPPQPGAYRNARVIYEADNVTYLYDSDGIPQLLVPNTEAIIAEAVSQIPTATSGSNGLMLAADKAILDSMHAVTYGTATPASDRVYGSITYIKYGRLVFLLLNNVAGNNVSCTTKEVLFTGLPPAHQKAEGDENAILFTVNPASSNASVNNPAVRFRITTDGTFQSWWTTLLAYGTTYAVNATFVYLAES